jgi:hypothetical protein
MWSMLILYKRVTLYTINFLLSLYASMNCVTSQFTQLRSALTLWYATSRNSPRHTDQRHTFYTSTVCFWFSYLENTLDKCLCFPFDGQCRECFTSSLLRWAPDELGLPRETPLIFALCTCAMRFRTRTSWNFLCVIFPPHNLCNKYALRMVMSSRWKNNFCPFPCPPGNSITIYHPVRFIHKAHMCIAVLNYTGFDSIARFILEVSIHWRRVHILQNKQTDSLLIANPWKLHTTTKALVALIYMYRWKLLLSSQNKVGSTWLINQVINTHI